MSIFPENNITINEIQKNKIQGTKEPLFDFKENKMIIKDGKVVYGSKKDNLEQWIRLLILTQVDKFKVYIDTGFGLLDLYNLIGNNYLMTSYGVSELKRELTEKIEAKEGVEQIKSLEVEVDFNKVNISMTITVEGESIDSKEVYNLV